MEVARGFGGLSSAAARASVAWRLGEAASKLGMGRHGRGTRYLWPGAAWGARQGRGVAAVDFRRRRSSVRAGHELEEGDDVADRRDRLVSETRRERGERGRRCLAGLLGRCGEREQAAQGKRAAQETRLSWAVRAKSRERGRKIIKLLFYFLTHHFKTNSNSNLVLLQILIKPKHHKINMHWHECINMYADLIFNFTLTKLLFF